MALHSKAVAAIEKRGCLLVYPLQNRKEPLSLWSELHPRTAMKWSWDEDHDDRVGKLWILREELSRSGDVVYAKWFQNRATFFSRDVFVNMLAYLKAHEVALTGLGHDSRNVLDLLESDSPLSTKQLKAAAELEGRIAEPTFNRAVKPLWNHLLLVGYGEFQDSSFPSLGYGATSTLFEDLYRKAATTDPDKAGEKLSAKLGEDNPFWKHARKLRRKWDAESSDPKP